MDKLPNLSQITYTPYDGDDKYDAEFYQIKEIYGGKAAYSSLIEVKVRNYPLTSFNNWYIEQDKYEYLINQPHDNKLYINFHHMVYKFGTLKNLGLKLGMIKTYQPITKKKE